jgi:hypothetical protein
MGRLKTLIDNEYWDSAGYWIELNPGFRVAGDAHGIVEDTKKAARAKLDWVAPCACPECLRLIAERAALAARPSPSAPT